MLKEYYAVLGIDTSATKLEIKKAYRNKVLLYHPDINSAPVAKQRFQEVQEAYDALYNDKFPKRSVYQHSNSRTRAKKHKQRTYSHFEKKSTNSYSPSQENSKNARRENTASAPLSRLGITVSYGFYYVVRGSAVLMFALPAFVLFFETRVFFSLSTFASLLMGWFFYKYSKDWLRDLKDDVKRTKASG